MALVTNTRRDLTEQALKSIGTHYFSVSVCGDEVEHAKPAPDIYLRAAELLGFEPEQCLAIEDSVTGTAAAEAAGCPVLVVPNDVEVPGRPAPQARDFAERTRRRPTCAPFTPNSTTRGRPNAAPGSVADDRPAQTDTATVRCVRLCNRSVV